MKCTQARPVAFQFWGKSVSTRGVDTLLDAPSQASAFAKFATAPVAKTKEALISLGDKGSFDQLDAWHGAFQASSSRQVGACLLGMA